MSNWLLVNKIGEEFNFALNPALRQTLVLVAQLKNK